MFIVHEYVFMKKKSGERKRSQKKLKESMQKSPTQSQHKIQTRMTTAQMPNIFSYRRFVAFEVIQKESFYKW